LAENPEKAFGGNGKWYKHEARISKLERLLCQDHAENVLFKKVFAMTQCPIYTKYYVDCLKKHRSKLAGPERKSTQ